MYYNFTSLLLCSLLCWPFGVQVLLLEITLMLGMWKNWWKGGIDYQGWSLKKVNCPELWQNDSCSDEYKLKNVLLGFGPVIIKASTFPFWVKMLHSVACVIRLPVVNLLLKIKSMLQFTQMSRRVKLEPLLSWWS